MLTFKKGFLFIILFNLQLNKEGSTECLWVYFAKF